MTLSICPISFYNEPSEFFSKKVKKGVDKPNGICYNQTRRRTKGENLDPYGSIAQLGEHLPYKQRVIGSSPIVPTRMAR